MGAFCLLENPGNNRFETAQLGCDDFTRQIQVALMDLLNIRFTFFQHLLVFRRYTGGLQLFTCFLLSNLLFLLAGEHCAVLVVAVICYHQTGTILVEVALAQHGFINHGRNIGQKLTFLTVHTVAEFFRGNIFLCADQRTDLAEMADQTPVFTSFFRRMPPPMVNAAKIREGISALSFGLANKE